MRKVALVLLLLALLGALLYSLRGPVVSRLLLAWLERTARREAGLELTVREMSGDWIGEVGLHGIEVASADGALAGRIEDLVLNYDLGRLLRGDLSGLESATIVGLDVRIEPAREPSAPAKTSGAFRWPEHLPAIELARARCSVRLADGGEIAAEGLALRRAADGRDVELEASRLALAFPALDPQSGALLAHFDLDRGKLDVQRVLFDGASLVERAAIDLTDIGSGRAAWNAVLNAFGGSVELRGGLANEVVATEFGARQIQVAGVQTFLHRIFDLRLQGRLDVEGTLKLPLDDPGRYTIDARGQARDPRVLDIALHSLSAEFALDSAGIYVARLAAQRDTNRVTGEDVQMPFGEPSALAMLRKSRGRFAARLADVPALLGRATRTSPHQVDLIAAFSERGLELDSGRLATPTGSLEIDSGSVQWGTESAGWLEGSHVDVRGQANFTELSDVAALFTDELWCGSGRGAVQLAGGVRELTGFVDLAGENLVIEGFPVGDASLRAEVDARELVVDALRARGDYGEIEGWGVYKVREQRIDWAQLTARTTAPSRFLPAAIERGLLEADLYVTGAVAEPKVAFRSRARELLLGNRLFELVEASGVAEAGRVKLERLSARSGPIHAELAGEVATHDWQPPLDIALSELDLDASGRQFRLHEPVRAAWDGKTLSMADVRLASGASQITLSGALERGMLDLHTELADVDVASFTGFALPAGIELGGVSGTVDVELAEGALSGAAQLAAARVLLAPDHAPYRGEVSARLSDGRLFLDDFGLWSGTERVARASGSLPLASSGSRWLGDQEIELRAEVELDDFGQVPLELQFRGWTIAGDLAAEVDLSGTASALRGALALRSRGLTAVAPGGSDRFGPATLDARLVLDPRLRIESFTLAAAPGMSLELGGSVGLDGDVERWLYGRGPTWRELALALDGRLTVGDLGFLARLSPDVRRCGGRAEAAVDLSGTLAEPRLSGTFALDDGELKLESDLPGLTRVQLRLAFTDDRAFIEELTGELGAGGFEIRGGVDGLPSAPRLDLSVLGKQILLVREEGVRLRADANLAVSGPLRSMRIAGELALRDGRYTENFDLLKGLRPSTGEQRPDLGRGFDLPAIRRGPLASAELDVVVRSKDPFEVKTNVVRSLLRPELRLRGSGAAPELYGDVFVDPSRLFLPSGTLYLKNGAITLPRESPIVPKLELSGEARMAGYDISVRIRGDYDEPDIILASTPQLAQSDLLLLLLTGRPPQGSGATTTQLETAQTVAVFIGQDLISQWFAVGDEDDSESLLQRIEWQQGQEVTSSGGRTQQVSLRLTSGDPRIRRGAYLRGERDVYDRINFGVRLVFRFE